MTAPDPGLTDLIAAHLVETVTPDGDCGVFILDCTCGAEVQFTQADLNAAPVDSTAGALHYMLCEHVAVELEQHTNSRIAEVNARAKARVKAANKRASIRITQIRKEEAARFEAEATITRVRGEISAYSEIIPAVALADLRAAMEGDAS
ncbi:hypothetical protein PXH69_24730 [Rhodococcus qingshengii]|uniref:Uncharacterized protein n=1 Tax=Rhodococcus qingshengii TaxID=334542 RepID=A0AAW6LSN2_RHOSG|nr:hypothetical protein [Rhodococcus qingshengii]MDE8648177.1 hypothetical protein [Rhodococcus qingshengii]